MANCQGSSISAQRLENMKRVSEPADTHDCFNKYKSKIDFTLLIEKCQQKVTKWYSYKQGVNNNMPFHRKDTFQWTAATFRVIRFSKSLTKSFDSKNQVKNEKDEKSV